jgi:signal transduction histidine kinase
MQQLPPLSLDCLDWRLPLCEFSASALVEALATEDRATITAALHDDPTFLVWIACRSGASVETCLEAADWLIDGGLGAACDELLTGAIGRPPEAHAWSPPAGDWRPWADLAAESILVAETAARLIGQSGDVQRAYFLGLVHKAPAWLEMAAFGEDVPEGLVPSSLAIILDRLAGGPSPELDAEEQAVAQAIQWLSGQAIGREDPKLDRARILKRRDELSGVWTDESGEAPRCWPSLSVRLYRLSRYEQRLHQTLEEQKRAAVAEFAAGAGHEINNPLANISGRAQLLARSEADPWRRQELATIHAQATRVHRMISDMMLYARPPEPRPEAVDVGALLDELVGAARDRWPDHEFHWDGTVGDQAVRILADPTQLRIALDAIVDNACEQQTDGGEVRLYVGRWGGDATSQPMAFLLVEDGGRGLSQRDRQHLFDPFYSGRDAGRGLGLGLSKVQAIAECHDAFVDLESTTGGGTTVRLVWPLADVEAEAA